MARQTDKKLGLIGLIITIVTFLGALPQPLIGVTCSPCYGATLEIEGLYWTVHQTDLDYAVDFDPTDADKILGKGKTHFIDYNRKTGARGTLGYQWCDWNANVVYTWYRNHAKDSVNTKGATINLKAAMLHPATVAKNAEKASGKSNLDYYTVDFLLGRKLYLCEDSINLHPFAGIRGLRLDQNLKVDYEGDDFMEGSDPRPARVDWKSELKALGLHVGMSTHYSARCGFGLFGSFAGSLLSSLTDVHHYQKTLDGDKKTLSTEVYLENKEHIVVPGYSLAVGITWDTCVCKRCALQLRLGYELNHWFNIPQLRRYHYNNEGVSGSGTSSNIGLHGATLAADFTF